MKKRYSLTFGEIGFIEVADFLFAFWIVGLFLAANPFGVASFFIEWKWAFFSLAVIVGIRPVWRMVYGPHSDEAKSVRVKKVVKKKAGRKKK